MAAGTDCELLITILEWGKGHTHSMRMSGTMLNKARGFFRPNLPELACRVSLNCIQNLPVVDMVLYGDRTYSVGRPDGRPLGPGSAGTLNSINPTVKSDSRVTCCLYKSAHSRNDHFLSLSQRGPVRTEGVEKEVRCRNLLRMEKMARAIPWWRKIHSFPSFAIDKMS